MHNNHSIIALDIGGAHLKLAEINNEGELQRVEQYPTPIWKGIEQLEFALEKIVSYIDYPTNYLVTMTAELVDIFPNRLSGINRLLETCHKKLSQETYYYSSTQGFLPQNYLTNENLLSLASANWHASSSLVAKHYNHALFIDVGSTTTDIIPIYDHAVITRGHDDHSRMRFEELIYSGVVRTPLMALTQRAPYEGVWQSIAAEYFATTADVYRILGKLHANADQMDTADGQAKDIPCSIRRVARMLGMDVDKPDLEQRWIDLANYFFECQLELLINATKKQIESYDIDDLVIVGAGAGCFLVKEIASILDMTYIDFSAMINCHENFMYACNTCAPAVALAYLYRNTLNENL